MKKILPLALAATILLGGLAAFRFVQRSNDHRECGTETVRTKDAQGNTVTVTKHVCKERYNL